jgi:hypothetical protein
MCGSSAAVPTNERLFCGDYMSNRGQLTSITVEAKRPNRLVPNPGKGKLLQLTNERSAPDGMISLQWQSHRPGSFAGRLHIDIFISRAAMSTASRMELADKIQNAIVFVGDGGRASRSH